MDAPIDVTQIERVDDVPLLLEQLRRMNVASVLNEHFPTHGNWQGLSLGDVVTVWLAYILSECDHRLNPVQSWVAKIQATLKTYPGMTDIRELDVSDDRLSIVLDYLGGDDSAWDAYEQDQGATLLRVYDLKTQRVRIDSTTVKSYVNVTKDGLFQFGHSKEHRPDLPQLKISMSALDPLGLPLTTTLVSGERADDPLYVPEIRKVQAVLDKHGVLYVGDAKMAALEVRGYIVSSEDHYLCPLPAKQVSKAELKALLAPVWTGEQKLTPVERASEMTPEEKEHIADGFSYQVALESGGIKWEENRLVIYSPKHANVKKEALNQRITKAEQAIKELNLRGRGRKRLDETATRAAVEVILKRHDVVGLLNVQYQTETKIIQTRTNGKKPAQDRTKVDTTVQFERNAAAYEEAVRIFGWRVFAHNDPNLSLEQAVLAYRAEYIIERGFNRLRGKVLGITPLYLSSTTRIKGLIRLLQIGLRVLCLIEYAVRKALRERGEKLAGIYEGNPKRATERPTTEMMLKVFRGISNFVVRIGEEDLRRTTKLNEVQKRILDLLGFPVAIYHRGTG